MKRTSAIVCTIVLAAVAGSVAIAQPGTKEKPKVPAVPATPAVPAMPDMKDMQLPPGMTMEDMMACIQAGTPGDQHAMLATGVGTWTGQTTQWMTPDAEPSKSESTCTVSTLYEGRYFMTEWASEIPGMGAYKGSGVAGFDNVSKEYFATWIDNMSTGLMMGKGEVSADGKTMTFNYTYNCPMTKKPAKMRQIEKTTGPNTRLFEMWGTDPKSGKEFLMMKTEMTRKG